MIGFLALTIPCAAWAKGSIAPAAAAPVSVSRGLTSNVTGGPTAGSTSMSTAPPASGFSGAINATTGSGGTALPPPPPQSVTQSAAQQGVPASETPQPLATSPGNGFSPQLNNQIRPSSSPNSEQLISVQASLAAGGLYTGPIDGINSAATRASIAQYQQVQGLPVTGNLDAETASRLNRAASTGSVASNGATSTAGTPTTTGGIATTATVLPGTPSLGPTSPVITSQPFPLSTQVNMSPFPPPGSTIQP